MITKYLHFAFRTDVSERSSAEIITVAGRVRNVELEGKSVLSTDVMLAYGTFK